MIPVTLRQYYSLDVDTCNSFQTIFLGSFNDEYNFVIGHFHQVKKKGLRIGIHEQLWTTTKMAECWINKKIGSLRVLLTLKKQSYHQAHIRGLIQWRNKEDLLSYKISRQGGNFLTEWSSTKILISGFMLPLLKKQYDH